MTTSSITAAETATTSISTTTTGTSVVGLSAIDTAATATTTTATATAAVTTRVDPKNPPALVIPPSSSSSSSSDDPTTLLRTVTDRRSNNQNTHHQHPSNVTMNNNNNQNNKNNKKKHLTTSRKRPTTTELFRIDRKNNHNNDNNNNINNNNNNNSASTSSQNVNDDPDSENKTTTTTTTTTNSNSNINNHDHFHSQDLYAIRSRTINRGSYAHEPQRQLFQKDITIVTPVVIPNSNNRTEQKRSKKKVTMLIGYLGTNYGGFQINEGIQSIQAEIELVLYRHQYISISNVGYPQKYHWSTSGRTDKGVHAAAQVISLKMELLPHELNSSHHHDNTESATTTSATALLDTINTSLPNDIRVLDICRTTKNFSAKLHRDYVQYRYMIPSICFYNREALNTIFATTIVSSPIMAAATLDNVPTIFEHHDSHQSKNSTTSCVDPNDTPIDSINDDFVDNNNEHCNPDLVVPPSSTNQPQQPQPFWHITSDEVQQIYNVISDYRSTIEQRQLLQSTVQQYIGTHSFHNFTKRCTSQEARSSRYIMDFIVEEPVVMEATFPGSTNNKTYRMEWIPTIIIGQSFLLNQIRKMVWLAIEIARGAVPASTLKEALQRKPSKDVVVSPTTTNTTDMNQNTSSAIRIGMAPAQGLFLDMSYYKNYNDKVQRTKDSAQTNNDAVGTLDWHVEHTLAHERWKEFRNTVITQHIGQEEIQHGNFLQHIYMQEHRSYFYSDFNKEEEENGSANNDDDDDNNEINKGQDVN